MSMRFEHETLGQRVLFGTGVAPRTSPRRSPG